MMMTCSKPWQTTLLRSARSVGLPNGVAPPAREVRKRIRAHQSGNRSLRQRLVAIGDLLLYIGMFAGLITEGTLTGLERAARVEDSTITPAFTLVRWAIVIVTIFLAVGLFKALLTFGPVLVRAPAQAWLLSSPIDRRTLLVNRFAALVLAGVVGGGTIAVLVVIVARLSPAGLLPWVAFGCIFGAAVVSVAVLL